MLIKGSRRYNLRHNSERAGQPEFGRMINGQGLGLVSRFRYGICPMSFNGCEVIAVHNALIYLGKPQPLKDVAFYMERFRVLMGFFGCNAYRLGKALEHFGAEYTREKNADNANAFIITFWTKRPLFSMIHTVLCVREAGMIKVYNRYNNVGTVELCSSVEEVAGKYRPIAVYKLS